MNPDTFNQWIFEEWEEEFEPTIEESIMASGLHQQGGVAHYRLDDAPR